MATKTIKTEYYVKPAEEAIDKAEGMPADETPENIGAPVAPEADEDAPITEADYQRELADAKLDLSKLALRRLQMMNEVGRLDFTMATVQHYIEVLNRRYVRTITGQANGTESK